MSNPDFVLYAKSYGATGHRVTAANELRSILSHCLSTGGVNLIDVPVDYSMNHQTLNHDINSMHEDVNNEIKGRKET